MAAPAFAAGLEIISTNHVGHAKTPTRPPSNDELDAIELPDYGLTQTPAKAYTPSIHQAFAPPTPGELERSQPPTPKRDDAAKIVPTLWFPKMNKWRVLAACMEYFGNGLNDSAPGALIPYIEKWYGIGYAVVSTIWISNAVGFILAAFASDFICARLQRAKSLMLSEISIIIGYAIIAAPVPFPVVVVAYAAVGFGEALEIAYNNVFCGNLSNSTVILGAAHGSYGIGGIIGPILATALVSNGVHWSYFYIIALGVRIMNFAAAGWSFWNYEKEDVTQFNNSLEQIASRRSAAGNGESSKLKMIGRALKIRTTLIGALFIFAYQGAEVSDAGWFISYLIDYRNGDPAHVGYVTSGFWAGIALGRFILTHLGRFGEKRLVFAMVCGCIVLQLMAWFIPNIIGEAVSVSILGFILGPVYPCAATVFTRLLPANMQVFAIGFISSMGSSGGAVVPFLTGLIAQAAGTWVLHPICIAFFVWMIVCWAFLPSPRKREE